MTARLLTKRQVAERLGGLHVESVARLAREGKLPKPIKLGGPSARCFWPEAELQAFIDTKMAERVA